MRAPILLLAGLLATLAATAESDGRLIALGDEAWANRASGHLSLMAAPEPIGKAIAAYAEAFEADPQDLEARWKLMRALYYQGEYVVTRKDDRLALFDRGKRLGEEGIDRLAERVGGRAALDRMKPPEIERRLGSEPNAPGIYMWTAVHWGLWGRTGSVFAATRQGVAGRIRDYAEIVIALDEKFDNAGGHRLLGRLHTEAPKIPFITGWVDRGKAIAALQRSLELRPNSIVGQLYLLEALHDYDRTRRAEAVERLRLLVDRSPHPEYIVEDLNALVDARGLLAEWTE